MSVGADLYGAERSLLDVVERMSPAWERRFVVPGPGRYTELLRGQGYAVDECAVPADRRHTLAQLSATLRLALLIRRTRADLVHLNLHGGWPAASAACLLAGVPLVIHVRNMLEGRPGGVERRLFQRAAAVICISEAVKEALIEAELISPAAPPRVRLIPDARPVEKYENGDRARFRAELGIPPGTPLVGIVARLDPMKGQDLFLQAAVAIAERVPGVRFLVVGQTMDGRFPDYPPKLHALAAHPSLAGRVVFSGYRSDVADVLAALDCFVHPSRRGAFVSVLIEAMAAGAPIVASDVDGIPECVGRDGTAELVSLDPSVIADAVCRVLTDSAHAASMSAMGRERARRLYDVGPLARKTEEVFAECLGAGGGAAP